MNVIFRTIIIFLLITFILYGYAPYTNPNNKTTLTANTTDQQTKLNKTINLPAPSESALSPNALQYLGAFRLPQEGETEQQSFEYSGEAMAYCSSGNNGAGSLYVTGHNWYTYVAEVTIPQPIRSKNMDELEVAKMIQPLTDIRNHNFDRWELEIPRVGLEVIDNQLYFCWGAHYQEQQSWGTHGVTSLNLKTPSTQKACLIDGRNYSTNDYMFEIPSDWAQQYLPGRDIACGRFRDGGWSGMGPSMYAVSTHAIKNADMDEQVDSLPLILYDDTYEGKSSARMLGYSHADSWAGGAWITTDEGSAVAFAGTHGFGDTWYGFANGVVWPTEGDNTIYPQVPGYPYNERGWWNTDFRACLIMYDIHHLAQVANGTLDSSEIQPYAVVDLTEYMFVERKDTEMQYIGGVAYDREYGRLYIQELFADGDRPIVHVFSTGYYEGGF